uniref:Putative prenyltransferase n=1 Tax=Pueraria candollei var. mirifica TaxID=861244 RepID=A0A7G7XLM0_9FABA|nr:putative prenyltransferase [Pueraria candollei var. mirifica]
MDRVLVVSSSPNAFSVTNGGNLWQRKYSTNNINYPNPSSCVSKASQHKRKTQIEYNLLRSQQPSLNHHYKCIEGGPPNQECNRKYVVKAAPAIPSFDSESDASNPKNIFDSVKNFLVNLYYFCYPYTMFARTLGTISASLLAVEKLSDISPLFFIGLLQVLVAHFFMDLYINGVNQVFDLEIDKINKPYLPLASGKLSIANGVFITVSSAIMSFWLSSIIGSRPLIWSLVLCFLPWTAYSVNVPLLRWKRYPLLAAILMFSSWGVVFPITFFLHMQTFVFKRPAIFPRSLIVSVVFLSLYSLGIALSKDIPDIEGDTKFGVRSLAAHLGPKRVFWICVSLFETAFGVALLAGATSSACLWIKIAMGVGNAVLASILWYQIKYIDLTSPASTISFYKLNWKLLCVAYFLLALIR